MAVNASLQDAKRSESGTYTPDMRQAIELELEAICSDAQFRASQRNCEFLRYVIMETLDGRAAEIKERTLGKELFGRPITYDTGSDAVVRVRANEVRKRLVCYYEEHESQAGWRIQLPLRTYVPAFRPEVALDAPQEIALPIRIDDPPEHIEEDGAVLTLSQMMIPTLIALFLCAATFRWQAFSGSPYLDFWETLLSGHAGIALVLDADPADPRAVTTDDLQMVNPLLRAVAAFHATTLVESSSAKPDLDNLIAIHVTHRSPIKEEAQAAYVTVVPGREAELWVGGNSGRALDLAINSISDTDIFPTALEVAIRRKTPTRIRFADKEQVTTETLPSGGESWKH
jgi:hypothetical protein